MAEGEGASPSPRRGSIPGRGFLGATLVLLGLPGAGKSTVGPLVAEALGRRFVDLDAEIERRAGCSIAELFARDGEQAFRALERSITAELVGPGLAPIVLSPGGGWVEAPEHRAMLGPSVVAVYLRVSPGVAVERMGSSVRGRPLLATGNPVTSVEQLLARRESFYLQSRHTVSVDSMSPEQVASSIVALARGEIAD